MRIDIRPVPWLLACATVLSACGASAIATPSPTPAPAATAHATATPAATIHPALALPARGALEPGTYTVGDPFPVAFDVVVSEDWSTYAAFEDGVLLAHNDFAPPGLVLFGAWQVDGVYTDPCKHTLGPPVGQGVDALVAGFRAVPALRAGAPSAATVGGRPATRLELSFPDEVNPEGCVNDEYAVWAFKGQETRFIPPGYPAGVDRLWILEVEGTRIVLSGSVSAGNDADFAALDALIGSIRFR